MTSGSEPPGATADLVVTHFDEALSDEWDTFVSESVNGTLLHKRKYLRYHGDRFQDESLVIRDRRNRLIGVIAAAVDPASSGTVLTHPGVTYGGLVHGGLSSGAVFDAIAAACQAWQRRGFAQVRYKVIPTVYHRRPAEAEAYALWRLGGRVYRVDTSATVDLSPQPQFSHGRRQGVRKAAAAGLRVESGVGRLSEAYAVVEGALKQRHGASPTHSLSDLRQLAESFAENIRVDVAIDASGLVMASAVSYLAMPCWHTQYLAASPDGMAVSALDLLIATLIDVARSESFGWFDFGISTEDGGLVLNRGLDFYKHSFGAGTTAYMFFEVDL